MDGSVTGAFQKRDFTVLKSKYDNFSCFLTKCGQCKRANKNNEKKVLYKNTGREAALN